jgi:hypothetical protein
MSAPGLSTLPKRIVSVLHSIRFRLVLWYTAILALVLFAFSAFIYIKQTRDILGESEFRLERKMAALGVTLTATSEGLLVPPGVLQDTDVFVFADANGRVLASHGPLTTHDTLTLASHSLQEYEQRRGSSNDAFTWRQGTGSARTS